MSIIKRLFGFKDYKISITNNVTGEDKEYNISSTSEANAVIKCFRTHNLPNEFTATVIN